MKREGKQRGMVRSVTVVPADPGSETAVNRPLAVPPAAGPFAKAPAKPTNHSKYTARCRKAKCRECHAAPVSKSRDKAKGARKLRSCDVLLNHRLVSWRVVVDGDDGGDEGRRGLAGCEAFSATEMLDHLCATGRSLHEGEEGEEQGVEEEEEEEEEECGGGHGETDFTEATVDLAEAEEEREMEFLVVGVSWETEEDWLVVGEM